MRIILPNYVEQSLLLVSGAITYLPLIALLPLIAGPPKFLARRGFVFFSMAMRGNEIT
jgi:hypothetical protein